MKNPLNCAPLSYFLVCSVLMACAPALPGTDIPPKGFKEYSERAEGALAKSEGTLLAAKKVLHESEELLNQAKSIKESVEANNKECKRTLLQAQSERKSAEKERRNAVKILKEAKEEKERVVEAVVSPKATPVAPAHSASDAP